MTVNDLIAKLSALSPEERELPVFSAFFHPGPGQFLNDPRVELRVEEVRTETLLHPHTFHGQATVRALRIF